MVRRLETPISQHLNGVDHSTKFCCLRAIGTDLSMLTQSSNHISHLLTYAIVPSSANATGSSSDAAQWISPQEPIQRAVRSHLPYRRAHHLSPFTSMRHPSGISIPRRTFSPQRLTSTHLALYAHLIYPTSV